MIWENTKVICYGLKGVRSLFKSRWDIVTIWDDPSEDSFENDMNFYIMSDEKRKLLRFFFITMLSFGYEKEGIIGFIYTKT